MNAVQAQVESVRVILGAVAVLSRVLSAEQRRPFEGRVLTGSQLSALFFLARSSAGLTPGRMSELLGVSAGAVTQLLDTLRAAGYIDIGANPRDARSRIIVLSASARQEVERFEADTAARLLPRFAGLTPSELVSLAELLRRITPEATQ